MSLERSNLSLKKPGLQKYPGWTAVMATQAIATILEFTVSYMHRKARRGGYIHSIKQEELLFVSHQRVTPTASHLRYSNRVLLDEVHKNMEGRNYLYMHRMRMVV